MLQSNDLSSTHMGVPVSTACVDPPRMAGPPPEGFDGAEQRGQVQAFDKTPDRARAMIVRHKFLQADRTPLDLAPCEASAPPRQSAPARPGAANVSKSSSFSFPAIGRPAKNQIPLLDSTRWKPASPLYLLQRFLTGVLSIAPCAWRPGVD